MIKSLKNILHKNYILKTFGALIVLYLFLRAYLVDFTHDEAYSFYNIKTLWWVEVLCTGNTHWLNFIALKTASLLEVEGSFGLRWLSLLSACCFIYLAYRYAVSANNTLVSFLVFVVIVLNPYVLDYLFLARGYASAITLQAISMYWYYLYLSTHNKKWFYAALISAGLSALANYNFYYYFVAYSAVIIITLIKDHKQKIIKQSTFYITVLCFVGISVFVIKALSFITKCSNDIGNYGGSDFFDSIIGSLLRGFLYQDINFLGAAKLAVYGFIFCVIVVLILIAILKHRLNIHKPQLIIALVLLIMFLLVVFNKIVLNVLYPIDRTILIFFVPIVTLITSYFLIWKPTNYITKTICVLLVFAVFINFYSSINFSSPLDYKEQVDAKKSFNLLQQLDAKHVGIAPEIYGVFRNYYQKTAHLNYSFNGQSINTAIPNGLDGEINKLAEFDYLILFPPYNLSFYQKNSVQFLPVYFYSKTKTLIVKVLPLKS